MTMGEAAVQEAVSRWGRATAWADRMSERLNTILVREVRRALNGRGFIISFFILLTLCVSASLVPMVVEGSDVGAVAGWSTFGFLFLSLCAVTFLGLPMIISTMVRSEISERTFELLSITTITAARIVWGEMLTAIGLFVLFTSAVAPFMAFSYLLGGVDLLSMATGIGLAFLGSMLLTMISVLGSIQQHGGVVARIGVLLFSIIGLIFAGNLAFFPTRLLQTMWDDSDSLYVALGVLTAYFSLMAIFFAAASGRLTFAAANRSGPVRLAVAAHILLLGGYCWIKPDAELFMAWAIYSMSLLFLNGMVAVGEEEALSRRQQRAGWIRRRLPTAWALFLPGARRGLAFTFATGIVVAGATCLGFAMVLRSSMEWGYFIPWLLLAYVVLYLAGSQGACALMPKSFRRPIIKRATALILFLATLLIPLILSLTLEKTFRHNPGIAAWNPAIYLPVVFDRHNRFDDAFPATLGVLVAGAIAFLLILPSLIRGLLAGAKTVKADAR